MEIKELRSFCAAARLHSISRAAEKLDLGQPTVTMHIKRLEDEMGGPLFDRVRRPIQLTPAGTALLELATPLVEGIDALMVKAHVKEEEYPVRVASTHVMIGHALLRAVRVFLKRYPHAHLRIRSGTMHEVLNMV
ncbi:MAG: LysR family transcriptional regulator, partial [SAR202 cluster bacterium]|nr:LysR family transcriptional regulator [SAR202 cluster bacterium]